MKNWTDVGHMIRSLQVKMVCRVWTEGEAEYLSDNSSKGKI